MKMAWETARANPEEFTKRGKAEPKKTQKASVKNISPEKTAKLDETFKKSWAYQYMSKPGNTLESLEKAISRMAKGQAVKRFKMFGVSTVHSRREITSIVLQEMENMGYRRSDE